MIHIDRWKQKYLDGRSLRVLWERSFEYGAGQGVDLLVLEGYMGKRKQEAVREWPSLNGEWENVLQCAC